MFRKIRKYAFPVIIFSLCSLISYDLVYHNSANNKQQEEHYGMARNDFYTSFIFNQNKSSRVYKSNTHLLRDIKERPSKYLSPHLLNIQKASFFVKHKNDCKNHKFLIYRCDYSRSCGGLGDRQRGIVSSFLLALISERVFIIDVDKPCELEHFMKPYLYDWTFCKQFIKTVDKNDTHEIDMIRENFNSFDNFNFSKWHWKVIILKINSNIIYQIRKRKDVLNKYGWLLNMGIPHIYNCVLSLLFQPKNNVLNFINSFIHKSVKDKTLVCCHIRKGKNPSIPQDNLFSEDEKPNETIVFSQLKQYADSGTFILYLASDSLSVREQFWKMFKNGVKFEVPIVHIDRLGKYNKMKEKACEGFKYVLIEQYILSICDILILTTDSGFGKYAAYMRGISDNLFLIQRITSKIVMSNLKNI